MSQRCDICSLDLQDEYALQGHLAGKKHLRKLQQFQAAERSIFVSPLPKNIPRQWLVKFFEQYGTIKWYQFGPNHIIITFDNSEATKVLLSKPVWINHIKLDIKKRTPPNTGPNKEEAINRNNDAKDTGPISYDKLKEAITKEETFKAQLQAFLNEVQLTDVEIKTKYEFVATELDKIFKVVFPKCKTHRFGSTLTGLCFKGCDLDIYIDIGVPICENEKAPRNSWTMSKIFKEAKKIIFGMKSVFSNVVSVPKAKTPIIKFRHVPTDISCDLSFKTSIAIYKTRFIKYCVSLDDRAKPLIMLLKYWAKRCNISGTGKLSSYALIMLIIFYLQQPSVNIIPPLMKLQQTDEVETISGWPVNSYSAPPLSTVKNTSSIPQLLHGFFSFYSTFEFTSQVICPLDGLVHADSKFKNLEDLPKCMDRYVELVKTGKCAKLDTKRSMCVQDPIEQNSNITASTSRLTLRTFVSYCTVGTEICAAASKDDYKNLMVTLFDTVVKQTAKDKRKFKVVIPTKHAQLINLARIAGISINNTEQAIKCARDNWYYTVFNIVKDIFEKVFKLRVEILTSDVEAKQQKVEAFSDVHTNERQEIKLHCTGYHKVWCNRNVNGVILDPSMSSLEKQALISDMTIKAERNNARELKLDFTCTFEKKVQPVQVILTICNENSTNKTFYELADFAKNKILDIVCQTLIRMQMFTKH